MEEEEEEEDSGVDEDSELLGHDALTGSYRRFGGASCLHFLGVGSQFLRNAGNYLTFSTSLCLRTLHTLLMLLMCEQCRVVELCANLCFTAASDKP